MKRSLAVLIILGCCSYTASAATSMTVSAYNDYLFNGVSQTNKDPALQASLDWAGDTGVYAGVWAGNVDLYGSDLEADVYAGYAASFASDWSYDVGVAQYTYHGDASSDEMDYAESHAALSYKQTTLTTWYAWDYFGTGAGHFIVKLAQDISLTDKSSLHVAVDRSQSLDGDKWAWEDSNSYVHWEVTGNYEFQGVNLSAGVHGTTLKTYGDTRLLFGISKTFSF